MHFSQKDEEAPEKKEVDITSEGNNQTIYGLGELSHDINSILKKIIFVYKSTLDLKDTLGKKSNVARGAITQDDIRSIIKIMSQDINNYMYKMNSITNKLRKSYLDLENKASIILESVEMDDKYTFVFNKSFFHKNLNIYMDKNIHEEVNSGVFLMKLGKMEDKTDVFIKNTHNAILKRIYPELRYLDVIAHISDNVFAVIIVNVSEENFFFMLKQIVAKTKTDGIEQAYSAGMIDQFDNTDRLMTKLDNNLEAVKNIKDDFIFA